MTALRQQITDAMVLRGFALRTRETYLACVSGLSKHYHCPPDRLDATQIQAYLLHMIRDKKLAYTSVNQVACACRFLFYRVLQHPNARLDIPMANVPKRLPATVTSPPPCAICSALGAGARGIGGSPRRPGGD